MKKAILAGGLAALCLAAALALGPLRAQETAGLFPYRDPAVVGGGYRSNMAGFGDVLSDAEIIAVLAYIKSTWPPRIIARHDRLNADAEAFAK